MSITFAPQRLSRIVGLISLVVTLYAPAHLVAKVKWDPIPAADLASKQSEKYPGVASELLFKHEALDSDGQQTWTETYSRQKIYNALGAQEAGILNIEYPSNHEAWDLAARVTKQNGTVLELGKKDFHENVESKYKGRKMKSLSVAVPNLESGDVVEYHWNVTVVGDENTGYSWLIDSKEPIREYTFTLRDTKSDCQVLWFNIANAKGTEVKGHQTLIVHDVPPFEDEPLIPTAKDIRGWVMVVNTSKWMRWYGKDEIWKELSSYYEEDFRLSVRPNGAIQEAAKAVIQGATTDDEKVNRLYDYARTEITNLDYFDNATLQAARKKLDKNDNEQSVSDTLKRKFGFRWHVNQFFASLCRAAGFEVKLIQSSSREDTTLVKNDRGFMFLYKGIVSVRLGETWKSYAPGDYFVPAGMLDWPLENAPGLLCEDDKKNFVTGAIAPASASLKKRVGKFTLDAEGNLEGTVEVTYTGHLGAKLKQDWYASTDEDNQKKVLEAFTEKSPTAELSDIHIENANGITYPVKVTYKLKIPGYAESAGERLIVTPSVFQKGVPAFFTSDHRKWPIYYDYAYTEKDLVEIVLPEGYELDAPSAPASIGKPEDPIRVRFGLAQKVKAHAVVFQREAIYGDHGIIALPAAAYPAVKSYYEAVQHSDAHTLVIKPKAAPTETPAATK